MGSADRNQQHACFLKAGTDPSPAYDHLPTSIPLQVVPSSTYKLLTPPLQDLRTLHHETPHHNPPLRPNHPNRSDPTHHHHPKSPPPPTPRHHPLHHRPNHHNRRGQRPGRPDPDLPRRRRHLQHHRRRGDAHHRPPGRDENHPAGLAERHRGHRPPPTPRDPGRADLRGRGRLHRHPRRHRRHRRLQRRRLVHLLAAAGGAHRRADVYGQCGGADPGGRGQRRGGGVGREHYGCVAGGKGCV
ncbi:uncharacterized protein BO95DRAFT_250546 [Aspergillus brunneoviolaceus CBS 621.78]|uniref:Uncharacterized protein n=1 Tax=Aspergillus brunneoviolaceus CBS 621.78 TaxID=1450534 RepID=A0ACD1GL12_9EURO|nr:hypothetical protein BO95DRAFT_250546 [Aspergillus brunneoviolaceus CBS 621.78]RAH49961.1 hypothetical protein BO95DRAFT_250546 [Aspergillus brunneoviolaceus CBS 621.78]